MKSLVEHITEQLNEAIEPETTFEIRNGKNTYSGNAKKIIVTGQADYAEVYINKDAKVEVIDFTGCQCKTIRIDINQCNKLKEIIGGSGDNVFCCIRKNVNLEKLELGNYQMFSDGKGGQMSYIDKNKKLMLSYDNLPKMVDARHGLDIENVSGKHILRGNGVTKQEPLKDVEVNEALVSERKNFKNLEQALTSYITDGLIAAWDEVGIQFTHQDVKDALENLAKNYDIDNEIDWAKEVIK